MKQAITIPKHREEAERLILMNFPYEAVATKLNQKFGTKYNVSSVRAMKSG